MIVFVDPKNFHLELYSIFFCLCHDPEVPVRYTMAISFYEVSLQNFFVSTYMFLVYILFFKVTFMTVQPKEKDSKKLVKISLSKVFSPLQNIIIACIHISVFKLCDIRLQWFIVR